MDSTPISSSSIEKSSLENLSLCLIDDLTNGRANFLSEFKEVLLEEYDVSLEPGDFIDLPSIQVTAHDEKNKEGTERVRLQVKLQEDLNELLIFVDYPDRRLSGTHRRTFVHTTYVSHVRDPYSTEGNHMEAVLRTKIEERHGGSMQRVEASPSDFSNALNLVLEALDSR